ncbi:MAG: 16S rRNA (adenine(1518)-N(6)/adenine(1519)-N(6))-dimethyltransferase RsmA [Rhodothermales bacterium]
MSIRPKQSLGQNFLHDPNIVRKIVDAVRAPADGHVVEIGAGQGALTGELLERFATFTAFEIDERAVAYLRGEFPDLDVRERDILQLDWASLAEEKGAPIYVVGNLPYNITSQILFDLIDARTIVREAVVMMQLEVAERLVAEPRTKAYGILSVQLQTFTEPELLFKVSPNVFFPRPDVHSAMVRLRLRGDDSMLDDVDPEFLRDVIRTAFNQRRKTLRNSLGRWTRGMGIELEGDLEGRRAEELTPPEFVALARYLESRS